MFGKAIRFQVILICAFALIVSGCGKKKEGKIQGKVSVKQTSSVVAKKASEGVGSDMEPNNTIEQAVEVQSGQVLELAINPKGDKDWFKVDLPGQGYLRVQANDVPKGLGMEVFYAVFDEWAKEKHKMIRNWNRLNDACFIPKAGTYYFAIGDDYSDASSEQTMKIKVDFLKEFDLSEPNNTPEKAVSVNMGDMKSIAIYPRGDNDWFKVKVEKQGYLDVKVKGNVEHIGRDIRYSFYDEWSDPKISVVRDWKRLPDACAVSAGKEYYFQIHDDYDDAANESVFDLKFDFIDQMDKNEPNNSFEQAKEIKVGDTLSIAIFPSGDEDFFKINSGNADKLNFLVRNPPQGIGIDARLFTKDSDLDEPKAASAWQRLPSEITVKPGKTYYVIIHDDYNDVGNQDVFGIKIEGNGVQPVVSEEKVSVVDEGSEEVAVVSESPEEAAIVAEGIEEGVDAEAARAAAERQQRIDAQKEQRAEMLKRRQEMEARQAEMRKRQEEMKKKQLEAMKAMQSQ